MAKIKYGLSNVYYAVATEGQNGALTYETPVAWPGAVSLSMSAQGDRNVFHADNIEYFVSHSNNGYEGDLETALIPESFRTDVLGEVLDAKGFYVESTGKPTVEFALLFQFENDEHATRHAFYRCVASRPNVDGSTKEETIEPQTETVSLTAMPRINDGVVKARAPYTASTASSYATWFTSVQEPTAQ